jgi:NAD(P)-dependent dehydrogenase (short-subunit alcohol dehydrogenase family)
MATLLNPPVSSSTLSVAGRYFLITGGTQGLGLAVARLLKENQAAGIVLVSRSSEKGVQVVNDLSTSTCQVFFIKADLSDATEASNVFARAEELIGPDHVITGVVNAAAMSSRGNLFTTTAEAFDVQMNINVRAPFLITQGAAQHMINFYNKHNGEHQQQQQLQPLRGSIVNICSCAAYGGAPFVMAYSASKAALVALTKNNAAELAPKAIRVNAVNMGWCYTDNENALQTAQTDEAWIDRADAGVPLGRILRPADVAATVCFLLSDASAMMTAATIELHPEFPHGMLSLLDTDAR